MSAEDAGRWQARLVDRVGEKLDLDATQKAKLAALAGKLREQKQKKKQKQALAGDGGNPRADVQALVAGSSFDRTRAQALVEAKTRAIGDKSPAVIATAADFFDGLRLEQQQKVREFMAGGHRRWGWRS